MTASGAEVHLAAPPTLLPRLFADYVANQPQETGTEGKMERILPSAIPHQQSLMSSPPASVVNRKLFLHWDLEPALKDADFIMTLRLQKERMTAHLLPSLREYHQHYGITRDRLKLCQPDVKILHPGPVNRGVEISSDLMDDPKLSLISEQVTSGIAVRMALLYLIGSGKS